MEWISVKDRLPEIDTEVLVVQGDSFAIGDVYISNLNNKKLMWSVNYMMQPTHWMPLPKPPEE